MSKSVHYRIIFGGDPIFMATTTLSQLAVLGTNSMLLVCSAVVLAAPPRISPATATKQKKHQQHNQNCFHVVASRVSGSGLALVATVSFLYMILWVAEDVRLITLEHRGLCAP